MVYTLYQEFISPLGLYMNSCGYIILPHLPLSLSLSPSLPASTDQVQSRREGATRESRVFFIDSTRRVNQHLLESTVPSVNFRGLMDPSPFQIADQTPMETVVEMFRKMGLRQVLVSHNG